MLGCLVQFEVSKLSDDDHDRRFFYRDKGTGYCICGLAREAFASFLRQYDNSIFMHREWRPTLLLFKNNKSVVGFLVEQVCLGSIAEKGLSDPFVRKPSNVSMFEKRPSLSREMETSCIFYIPEKFNYKAIDGILLEINNEAKEAHLVPIQVTISKNHKDSETAFFQDWSYWRDALEGYDIRVSFVWIVMEGKPDKVVAATAISLRDGDKEVNPDYTRKYIAIKNINARIAENIKNLKIK